MPPTLTAPVDAKGKQKPRISLVPESITSSGKEAIELCEMAGLFLDPWEKLVLDTSLGEREDGQWSAFEIGLMVSRQNGKGSILEARELAGLFLLGERLIIHSAHEFPTSLEHFIRLKALVENNADFSRRIKRISNSHGEEGIELKNGQRIRFRTRTKGGARGFTGDLVVFDEAMDIPESTHAAVLPTLSARSVTGNPQVWYTGSAVDQWTHDNGLVFARVRERGHQGDDPALAYFEWSVDAANPIKLGERAGDEEAWAEANPALGIRISAEHVERERRSMDSRSFAVERMGVGDWPATNEEAERVISSEKVALCRDAHSKALDPVQFSFDVTPDRSHAAIGIAARREDGLIHIEVVDHRSGTGWVAERLAELVENWKAPNPRADASGPAASLLPELQDLGIEVDVVDAKEHARSCGQFFDSFEQETVRHLGTPELEAAQKGARKRPLGDAWAWSRKSSSVDISPLVAVTLALGGLVARPPDAVPLIAIR